MVSQRVRLSFTPFAGREDEDVDAWLRASFNTYQLGLLGAGAPFTNFQLVLHELRTKALTDMALQWLNDHTLDAAVPTVHEWVDLEAGLRARFATDQFRTRCQNEYVSLRMTASTPVRQFNAQFVTLKQRNQSLPAEFHVRQYLVAAHPLLAGLLDRPTAAQERDQATLERLMRQAEDKEILFKQFFRGGSSSSSGGQGGSSKGDSATNSGNRDGRSGKQGKPFFKQQQDGSDKPAGEAKTSTGSGQRAGGAESGASGTRRGPSASAPCNNCGSPNHWAPDCPQPRQGNEAQASAARR